MVLEWTRVDARARPATRPPRRRSLRQRAIPTQVCPAVRRLHRTGTEALRSASRLFLGAERTGHVAPAMGRGTAADGPPPSRRGVRRWTRAVGDVRRHRCVGPMGSGRVEKWDRERWGTTCSPPSGQVNAPIMRWPMTASEGAWCSAVAVDAIESARQIRGSGMARRGTERRPMVRARATVIAWCHDAAAAPSRCSSAVTHACGMARYMDPGRNVTGSRGTVGPRHGGHDSARKCVVLYGGSVDQQNTADTWEWDCAAWKEIG